jgi:hypothetical protein
MGYQSQPDAVCIPTADRVKHERGLARPGVERSERLAAPHLASLSEHRLHLRPAHLAPAEPELFVALEVSNSRMAQVVNLARR